MNINIIYFLISTISIVIVGIILIILTKINNKTIQKLIGNNENNWRELFNYMKKKNDELKIDNNNLKIDITLLEKEIEKLKNQNDRLKAKTS